MSPLSAASAASVPKDKSFGARATGKRHGRKGVREDHGKTQDIFQRSYFFEVMKPHFGFVSPSRIFILRYGDPIDVDSYRPDRGSFSTDDLLICGPMFDTGCAGTEAISVGAKSEAVDRWFHHGVMTGRNMGHQNLLKTSCNSNCAKVIQSLLSLMCSN